MSAIELQRFIDISNQHKGPLKVNLEKGTVTATKAGILGNMLVTVKAKEKKLEAQNQKAIEAFRESLVEEFGDAIANKSLESAGREGNRLTGVMVISTVKYAEGLKALLDNAEERITNCVTQKEGGSPIDIKKILGETGVNALGLHVKASILAHADAANFDIDATVSSTVTEFYASGEAELCKKLVYINENSDLKELLQATLKGIVYNEPKRSELYKPFLELALAGIMEKAIQADGRDGCPILQSLGKQLADTLDEHITCALYMQHEGQDYDKTIDDLTHDSNSRLSFLEKNRGTFHYMQTEVKFFARNINQLFDRVANKSGQIGEDFFNSDQTPELTNITITNSDPHHGGQRVMILEFNGQQDQRIVYKPRDCRIDAKLVGGATQGVEKSVASLVNELSGEDTIATYHFLLDKDDGGHFGFIEFLNTEHNLESREQVNKFYKEAGQLAAIAYLTGTTDLHQGNLIVSNGHPFLTDLEMSGSKSVLSEHSIGSTGIGDALSKKSETGYVTPFTIGKDKKIAVKDNREISDTNNFITLNGEDVDFNGDQEYKDSFGKGFKKIIDMFHDNETNELLVGLLKDCGGMHVRYHPVNTEYQKTKIFHMELNNDKLPKEIEVPIPENEVDSKFPTEQFAGIFKESMTESHRQLDVAYYTRELGQAGVFYHSAEHSSQLEDEGQYFDYDSLEEMITRVESIVGEEGYRSALSAVDSFLGSLRSNDIVEINLEDIGTGNSRLPAWLRKG